MRFLDVPAEFRADAALSVRRGWWIAEWRKLAESAGFGNPRVWTEYGTRILLAHSKLTERI
jgi:hypothetical protein